MDDCPNLPVPRQPVGSGLWDRLSTWGISVIAFRGPRWRGCDILFDSLRYAQPAPAPSPGVPGRCLQASNRTSLRCRHRARRHRAPRRGRRGIAGDVPCGRAWWRCGLDACPSTSGCGTLPMSSARHRRRYSRAELLAKVRAAGFEVSRCTSFFTATLPLIALYRLTRRGASSPPVSEVRISKAANAVATIVLKPEWWLIKVGLSLPIGSSLMVVARRPVT